jgi:hypothetical protein
MRIASQRVFLRCLRVPGWPGPAEPAPPGMLLGAIAATALPAPPLLGRVIHNLSRRGV